MGTYAAANVLPIIRDIQAAGQRHRRAAQRSEGRHR